MTIHSGVEANWSEGGSGSVDNGIGTEPETVYVNGLPIGVRASGQRLRELSLENGTAEFTVNLDGRSHVGEPRGGVQLVYGVRAEVTDYAVSVHCSLEPTYAIGPHDQPVIIENPDPENREFWTAFERKEGLFGQTWWERSGTLAAQLHGPWQLWDTSWTGECHPHGPYATIASFSATTDLEGILSIMDGGAIVQDYSCTVIDAHPSIVRTGRLKGRFYAPAMFVHTTGDVREYGGWKRVSFEVILPPGQSGTLTYNQSTMEAITYEVTVGGAIGGTVGISDLVGLKIDANFSQKVGRTAALTVGRSATFNLNNTTLGDRVYWISGRGFWRKRTGGLLSYGANGYQGLGTFANIYWESGSKQAAEAIDSQLELRSNAMVIPQ